MDIITNSMTNEESLQDGLEMSPDDSLDELQQPLNVLYVPEEPPADGGSEYIRPLFDDVSCSLNQESTESRNHYMVRIIGANKRLKQDNDDLERKCKALKVRLDTLAVGFVASQGRGKNRFVRNMKKLDDINSEKIARVVNDVLAPNEMILREGWDGWGTDSRTFCQNFIKRAEVTKPAEYRDMAHYWKQLIAPMINYCMGNKRNNLHQIVKRVWMGKIIHMIQ